MKLIRTFSTTQIYLKKVLPTNLKGKSVSSQQWLTRQLSDPYVEKAKSENYRCRSAFKLIEIDDKYQFLKPGCVVVDCGAAPGSWTQVAVRRVNADNNSKKTQECGTVISVDKQQVYPITGAHILGNMDFTLETSQKLILGHLNGSKADVVLSDMAPSATGIKDMDNENMLKLCYSVLRFAVQVSKIDATLLVKLWQCGETKQLENDIFKFYNKGKIVKPNSSRSDSAEIFILARNFKGLKSSA